MINKLKNSPYSMQSSTMVNQMVVYGNMTLDPIWVYLAGNYEL